MRALPIIPLATGILLFMLPEIKAQPAFAGKLQQIKANRIPPVKHRHKSSGILLRIYRNFFSSQDGNTCTFSPTCSQYGYQAVKRKGVFTGVLATTDRLCRCNPYTKKWYVWNTNRECYEDPVE